MSPALRAFLSTALLGGSLLSTGCRTHEVVRVVDGVQEPGRFISDSAYAAYTMGAEWEARAQYENALAAYAQAAQFDPESVEVFSRIAALFCILDRDEAAEQAFSAALARDMAYEPTWRRMALCAEREGRMDDALKAAAHAATLDPERDRTILLYARLLDAVGRHDEAWPWLRGLTLRSPASREVWQAVEEHARERRPAWARRAQRVLDQLAERYGPLPNPPQQVGWREVDQALAADDLEGARRATRRAHLDPRLLGARAIVVGRPKLALVEARLRAGADPTDAEAQVVLALAALLAGEPATVSLRRRPRALGPVGEALFAELLLRQAGADAAELWLGPGLASGEVTVDALRERARRAFLRDQPGGATK